MERWRNPVEIRRIEVAPIAVPCGMGPNLARLYHEVERINAESHHHSDVAEPAADDPLQIRWAWVGHNASHEFHLGVDSDDRVWERSGCYDDLDPDESGIQLSEPELVGDWADVQYIGHW